MSNRMSKTHRSVRAHTEGAILIAVAEILSLLPLYKFPWGGSVDFAMLPILLFCCRWGFGPSAIACVTHSLLQFLLDPSAIGWESILGDFLIAYSVLCVAGLFRSKFLPGAVVACAARFSVHYAVGATIWAEYMPEKFFGMTMTSPWIYSALYNGAYMLPDLLLILALYLLLLKTPLAVYFKGEDLK